MQLLFTLISIALATGIVTLHLLSALLRGKPGKIFEFVNIALHIPFVFTMLYAGASLELLALAFMTGILVYVVAFEVKRVKEGSRLKKEGDQ